MSCIDKWASINRTILNERIAILALQETHLDEHLLEQIRSCFGKNLEIINSPLPSSPRASAGVAFIINKALMLRSCGLNARLVQNSEAST